MDIKDKLKKVEAEIDTLNKKDELSDDEQIRHDGLVMQQRALVEALNIPAKTIPMPNGETRYETRPRGMVGARYEELFPNAAKNNTSPEDVNKRLVEFFEKRTVLSGVGAAGGFAVPGQVARDVVNKVMRESIFLGKMTVYGMQNSEISIPVLDSSNQGNGLVGGMTAQIVAEGASFTEQSPNFGEVILRALQWGIFTNASNQSLADSGGRLDAIITQSLSLGIRQTIDEKIITGNGVACPLGILHADSAITISRTAANAINYADIVKMVCRIHPIFMPNAIWVASNEALQQLMHLVDANNNLIWNVSGTQGADKAAPQTLLGKPLFVSDFCSQLGTRGDLILVDPTAIGFALRQDLTLENSNSVEWYKNLLSFRAIMRANAKPLLLDVITPRNGGDSLSFATVLE